MKNKLAGGLALSTFMLTTVAGYAGSDKVDDFTLGMQQVEQLNFKKAGKHFENEMEQSEEGSPEWIKSTLGYAISLHRRQPDTESDKTDAAELYVKVIKYAKKTKSPYYALALLQQGKLFEMSDFFEDKADFASAVKCYDAIITDCPKSNLIHYAALSKGQALIFQMEKEKVIQGIDGLKAWLKKYPDNRFASIQWLLVADAYAYPLNDYKQAVAALKVLGKIGLPAGMLQDKYYWKLANYASKAGDFKTTKTYLNKIINLGGSRFTTVSKDMLKTLGGK